MAFLPPLTPEAPSKDLSPEALVSLLKAHGLPCDQDRVDALRGALDCAVDCKSLDREQSRRLQERDATRLYSSAAAVLRIAQENDLATNEELSIVRKLQLRAEIALVGEPAPTGPSPRRWIGPACALLLENWRTHHSGAVFYWDKPSPALQFLTDCLRLIDNDICESAVRRALDAHSRELAEEGRLSEEDRAAAYERFCDTTLGRLVFALHALK